MRPNDSNPRRTLAWADRWRDAWMTRPDAPLQQVDDLRRSAVWVWVDACYRGRACMYPRGYRPSLWPSSWPAPTHRARRSP